MLRIPQALQFFQSFARRRFFGFHHFHERVKEISRVVRAGAGLGVVLDAEDGKRFVAEAFDGLVVEVDVRHHAAVGFQGFAIDREAVILAGDFDPAGVEIFDRLIAAAMAELQLVRRRADGAA